MMTAASAGGEFSLKTFVETGLKELDPVAELEQEPNMPAGYLAGLFNAQGPHANCLTACAASSQAVGEATEIIRRGEADVMLSGGAHSMIHPFGVSGFNLLTALSERNDEPQRASRPFDLHRDGFVLGEGAAMVVLEEYERAKRRGAPIYGEIAGYGTTADAYRITDTHPEGRGAARCMTMALNDAGLNLDQVHYINAHGTSTAVNDRVETVAIRKALAIRPTRSRCLAPRV
jgi:3-oxoacyl-[acyl-carrier-protein] synthase II